MQIGNDTCTSFHGGDFGMDTRGAAHGIFDTNEKWRRRVGDRDNSVEPHERRDGRLSGHTGEVSCESAEEGVQQEGGQKKCGEQSVRWHLSSGAT